MADDRDKTGQPRTGYDAQDITVLEGLEAVRKRPGMYIGSTGVRGLHHLVYEVVDNSVDEALAGYCDTVSVTIHPDNSVTVVDNGRGIPVATMEKEGKSALEVVLTVLHAGGKFGDGGGYKVSGGLHGVGVSVVNALSERLHVEVRRDGFAWTQDYARGAPQGPITQGRADRGHRHDDHVPAGRRGLRDARVRLLDARAAPARDRVPHPRPAASRSPTSAARATSPSSTTRAASGTSSSYLNENKDPVQRKVVYFEAETEEGAVEVAMQWNSSYQESIFSFANNINTHEGGSHLSGFRSALTRTLNRFAREQGPPQGEGRQPLRRGRARGPDRGHQRQARRAAVRGPDEDQARQPGHGGLRRVDRQLRARRVPRGEPGRGQRGHPQGGLGRPGPRRRPQGARPHAPQVGAGELGAAGQARRLLDPRPVAHRALHRRGRLRRRLREAGPRPRDPGGAAAARQDPQRREGADRQGPAEQRDPGADHRARHRRARRVRHRAPALPQDHPDDGRRRGRRPHPDADPHAAVPRDAGADRARLRLHRQAAAVQAQAGPAGALHREGLRAGGDPARRQARALRGDRPRRRRSSTSPRRAGSATPGCSSSTRAGRRRCAPSTATTPSRSSRSRRSSTSR